MSTVLVKEERRIHQGQHDSPAVQFGRREFLEIVYTERPRIVYRSGETHFFFLVGLKVRTDECGDRDFGSNHIVLPWLTETVQ